MNRYIAPGSLDAYGALALAYARSMRAEAVFEDAATAENAKAADDAWLAVVKAVTVADDRALGEPSLKAWIERRLEAVRILTGMTHNNEGRA